MTKTLTLKTLNPYGYLRCFIENTITLVFSKYLENHRIGFMGYNTQYKVIITRLGRRRGITSILTSRPLAFCVKFIVLF